MKGKSILYIEFLENTAANHLLMIIKGVVDLGMYNIICICQKNSFLAFELKKIKQLHVYEFEYKIQNSNNKLEVWLRNTRYLYLVIQILLKHKVTIIHSHRLAWSYVIAPIALIFRIPLVIQIVVMEKSKNVLKNFIIKYVRSIHFIAVSHNTKIQFIKIHGINSNRIFVHYGGIYFPDIQKNRNIKVPELEKINKEGKVIIGMISRMDPLKGVDIFIEAAGILSVLFPHLHFVHIGNNPNTDAIYYQRCKQHVRNLNLVNRFSFINYENNILPYYKYFYLTALPTYKDTLAYVNIESSSFKVPAIATEVAGVPETISAKEFCLIPFPPSSVTLAKKIHKLLNNKEVYKDISKKSSEFIFEKFNSEKNATKLMRIYKKLE